MITTQDEAYTILITSSLYTPKQLIEAHEFLADDFSRQIESLQARREQHVNLAQAYTQALQFGARLPEGATMIASQDKAHETLLAVGFDSDLEHFCWDTLRCTFEAPANASFKRLLNLQHQRLQDPFDSSLANDIVGFFLFTPEMYAAFVKFYMALGELGEMEKQYPYWFAAGESLCTRKVQR